MFSLSREYNLEHLSLHNAKNQEYKSPNSGPRFKYPERDRESHIEKLKNELNEVINKFEQKIEEEPDREAVYLTIEGKTGYNLKSDSAADRRSGSEVLKKDIKENAEYAVVRVTQKGLEKISKKMREYEFEETKLGNPKNRTFLESIEKIRTSLLNELWIGKKEQWPDDENQDVWIELWIIGGSEDKDKAKKYRNKFYNKLNECDINNNQNAYLKFSERQVILVKTNIIKLKELITKTDLISEIHPASRALIQQMSSENNEIIDFDSIIERIIVEPESNVRITIIDTGINYNNPLLAPIVSEEGLYTVDSSSELVTDNQGHGTEVAGIAAYGDIAEIIRNEELLRINYKIESVRIPIDRTGENKRLWGKVIEEAVATAEEDTCFNRVYNLSVGSDDKPNGQPTSWSAEIDQLCFNSGKGRLITVAAGNVNRIDNTYPFKNLATEIDDPAQALNAICVGGYTNFDNPMPPLDEYNILANKGELSPHSCTGLTKSVIKPDVVWEAGNAMYNETYDYSDTGHDGISLVTTNPDVLSKPVVNTWATSVAAPGIARLLAKIWANNPELRPETVRGLLIHSSNWTESMINQFENKYDLLRACGYGVPNLNSALKSSESDVTLIAEDEIQVHYQLKMEGKTKYLRDLCYYEIPWPSDLLLELGPEEVELRVTLSYFIEPNPKQSATFYEGARLDWRVQGPSETDEEFLKRVNKNMREEGETGFTNSIDWEIGSQARSRGTVQSDKWNCIASDLATCKHIAVFPVNGWWKDSISKRKNSILKFSLIVSIKSEDVNLDLYNPIKAEIVTPVDIDISL